jgi:hypothetical protein
MPLFSGYLPWTGFGTSEFPYQNYPLQIALQARANMVLNGYSCFDATTGVLIADRPAIDTRWNEIFNGCTRLVEVGSGVLCEFSMSQETYDYLASSFVGYGGQDTSKRSWRCEGSLDAYLAYIVSERHAYVERFREAYPLLNWTGNAVGSAFEVLDELRLGDTIEQDLWAYYRQVFTPALPTDEQPALLFERDGIRAVAAKIDRCLEFATASDDLTNPIRRSELCYWLIVYTECLNATGFEL